MGITEIFLNYYQYFLRGTQTTVIVSLITVLLGTVLAASSHCCDCQDSGCAPGLPSCISPSSGERRFWCSCTSFTISFTSFRGRRVPFWRGAGAVMPCILALSMNSTAYVAEVIRSGIQAVDFGQTEAALSCGMTRTQAMVNIILPQAVKNILPALGNEFVTMIKETSIIQYLGVGDLMYNNGIVVTAPTTRCLATIFPRSST